MGISAAIAAAGVVGAGASIYAGNKAAGAQESAANTASNTQLSMFNQTQKNLQPYMDVGKNSINPLMDLAGFGNKNPGAIQAELENLPGYQFTKYQGLKAAQNGAAARGLGVSGASQRAAADYTTGLADQTYGEQFNRLLNLTQTGANAATGLGEFATQTGSNVGNNIIGAGNARAGSYINAANNIGNAAYAYPTGQIIQNGIYGSGNNGVDTSGNFLGQV